MLVRKGQQRKGCAWWWPGGWLVPMETHSALGVFIYLVIVNTGEFMEIFFDLGVNRVGADGSTTSVRRSGSWGNHFERKRCNIIYWYEIKELKRTESSCSFLLYLSSSLLSSGGSGLPSCCSLHSSRTGNGCPMCIALQFDVRSFRVIIVWNL